MRLNYWNTELPQLLLKQLNKFTQGVYPLPGLVKVLGNGGSQKSESFHNNRLIEN